MSDVVDLGERGGRDPYRRRHLRQTATFLLLVLLVLGLGGAAYLGWTGSLDVGGDGRPAAACPAPTQTAARSVDTPVRVWNASGRRGLAAAVAKQLQLRGFRVPAIDTAPAGTAIAGPVQVRYGIGGQLQSRTVAAQFRGTPELVQDDTIPDESVDLYLGPAFAEMTSLEQAVGLLAPIPAPSPQGCVADASSTPAPLIKVPAPRPATPTTTP